MAPAPVPTKRTVGIALGVLGFLAWWGLILWPQWRVIADVRPKVVTLRQQLRETRDGIAQIAQWRAKEQALRTSLKAHPRSLAQERMPVILDEVAALAKARGPTVDTVRPTATKGVAAKNRAASVEAETAEYLVIPIEILGRAGYHEVGAFLDALEHTEQLYQVQTLTIEADRKSIERHRVVMTIDAYLAVTS